MVAQWSPSGRPVLAQRLPNTPHAPSRGSQNPKSSEHRYIFSARNRSGRQRSLKMLLKTKS